MTEVKLTIEIGDTKDEDGDYLARVAEYPGLSAFGPSQADALREIANALIGISESPDCMKRLVDHD